MNGHRLALCIPTYQRADVIGELLSKKLKIYLSYGMDIYIFDSSPDDGTQIVVEQYQREIQNLYYVHIDTAVHSNMKVYMIFQKYGFKKDYEYVWVCSDVLRWSDQALERLSDAIEQQYDLIVLNYRDVEKLGTREYTDKNQFFLDCAWHMTLYGSTVLRTAALLDGNDWNALEEKYCIPERINHSHVAFYFEKLAVMERFRAIHISLAVNDISESIYRQQTGWRGELFHIWCDAWKSTIMALPDQYPDIHKKAVIRKHGINSKLFCCDQFKEMRIKGEFNYSVYKQYLWKEYTDVPSCTLFILSVFPQQFIYDKSSTAKRRLSRFCKKHKKIYIYGCGKIASVYTEYLEDLNIQFEGYVVTESRNDNLSYHQHMVKRWDNELLNDKETGIIMALNKENLEEVINYINDDRLNKKIFVA